MKFIAFISALFAPALAHAHGYHAADYISVFGFHLHPEHILGLGLLALIAAAVTTRIAFAKSKNKRR
ncbi:MAG: hypothetical protein AAF607_15955 [Pseudomonadota bacterium]